MRPTLHKAPNFFKGVSARIRGMKKKILKMFADQGILVDPDAADALAAAEDALACANAILGDAEHRPLLLTKADVDRCLASLKNTGGRMDASAKPAHAPSMPFEETARPPEGNEILPGVRNLKDITGNSTCVGNVIDFAKLFNDRYVTIKKMLVRRRELSGTVPISRIKKIKKDVKFVGIVNDSQTTKNGHTMLDLEDESERIKVLIMKGAIKAADSFINDEVIGVIGTLSRDGTMVVAKEIIRPEVPVNSAMVPNGSGSVVAFVSDIHVGSAEFLPEAWSRFVEWLNNDPAAEKVRYIIMPGDLVDGIGIYPGQEEELVIEDIYAQYRECARLVSAIPKRIQLLMMPGNHDAVRLAEPQPALPEEIQSMFDRSHTAFLGNPCYLEIEGRIILAYHGRSFDDFIGSVRNLSYKNPENAMKEMLRRRHLAPIYGGHTALAPEQKDYLVIDRVPHIFVTGHVHACAVAEYRGIKLINASAWQSQTAFQRMHNQIPDPAKVPMVDLGSGKVWVEDFSS